MSNALIDCLQFVPDDILPNFCDISAACFFFSGLMLCAAGGAPEQILWY